MGADLSILPPHLRSRSISSAEIVLPLSDALEAIDILMSNNFSILGYEGWVKAIDGRVGHGTAGRYTASYPSELTIEARAALCRKHLMEDAEAWKGEYGHTTDLLHFCITARPA